MQVVNLNLPICLAPNAYFFPSCNGNIIQKINDIVKVLGEHLHTQVEMCSQLIMQLVLHES
jgi:hypothetical protein